MTRLPFDQPYNGRPPFVRGSDTSEAAANRVSGKPVTGMRLAVLESFDTHPLQTCDDVEARLGLKHQTASARIRELVLLGHLEDTGNRSRTRSGSSARVYART